MASCGNLLSINPTQLYKNPPAQSSNLAPKRKPSMSDAEDVQADTHSSKRSRHSEIAPPLLPLPVSTQAGANTAAPMQPRYPKIFTTDERHPPLRSIPSNVATSTPSEIAIPRRYSTQSERDMLQVPGGGDSVSWSGSPSINYGPPASRRPHTESPAPLPQSMSWDQQIWPQQTHETYSRTYSPQSLYNMPAIGVLATSTGLSATYSPPNTMASLHHSHTFPTYGPLTTQTYEALPPPYRSSTFSTTDHSRRKSQQDPTTTVIQRVTSYQARRRDMQTTEDAEPPASKEDHDKPRCWEHGCNGREFSTFSNLLRHQREKAGTASKSNCTNCGAEFTRTTARNSHLRQAKCRPRRRSNASSRDTP